MKNSKMQSEVSIVKKFENNHLGNEKLKAIKGGQNSVNPFEWPLAK